MKPSGNTARAFTLIELLVVIAIIAVLAAGLFDRRHPWSLKLRIHPLFMPAHAHRWRVRLLRRGRSCLQQLPV